jgi:hypothetical protein
LDDAMMVSSSDMSDKLSDKWDSSEIGEDCSVVERVDDQISLWVIESGLSSSDLDTDLLSVRLIQ